MNGIKVKIKTIDQNNKEFVGEGYMCRRLNVDLYEIWCDTTQELLLLSREEFVEEN